MTSNKMKVWKEADGWYCTSPLMPDIGGGPPCKTAGEAVAAMEETLAEYELFRDHLHGDCLEGCGYCKTTPQAKGALPSRKKKKKSKKPAAAEPGQLF